MPISHDYLISQLSVTTMVVLLREVLTILFKVYAYTYIFPLSLIALDGAICDQSLITCCTYV